MSESLASYLLGKLQEAERDALEERCFTDPEQYYRLCETEQALIDDYVRGYLTAADRARFEQHFLALPARIERVKLARALLGKIDGLEQPAPPVENAEKVSLRDLLLGWLRAPQLAWGVATVMLLLAIGGWRLVRDGNWLRAELANAEADRGQWQRRAQTLEQQIADERTANARLNETVESLRNQKTAVLKPIVFALAAGVLRGEEGQALPTLALARNSAAEQIVRLRLTFAGATHTRYEAVLQTAEGQVIQKWPGVKAAISNARRAQFELDVPARRLAAADYVLILNGRASDEVTRSAFRVTSR